MEIITTHSFSLAANTRGDPRSDKIALALPGRLDTKDYTNFESHIEYLSSLGFYALAVDPPGTWDSPGGIELFTTTNYIRAITGLIEHLGGRPTLLLGHSRGGSVSILVGTPHPNVLGLVLVNPSLGAPSPPDPQSVKAGFYMDYRDLPPGKEKTKRQKEFKVPLAYFEDGGKYDDAKVLKTCTKPKLIFSSAEDEFNSPAYVKEVFTSLPEPKAFHQLPGTHDYRYFPEAVGEVNQQTAAFIKNFFIESVK